VLNDYTLESDLDRQFGDVPVGLRKMLLIMIHGLTRPLAVSFTLTTCRSIHACERPAVGSIMKGGYASLGIDFGKYSTSR
jgi:hypothetical protein